MRINIRQWAARTIGVCMCHVYISALLVPTLARDASLLEDPPLQDDQGLPAGVVEVPELTLSSAEVGANGIACQLCRTISVDILESAAGFHPLGTAFNSRFNKTLEQGDIAEVIEGLCEMDQTKGGQFSWDVEKNGMPPVVMAQFYAMWLDPHTYVMCGSTHVTHMPVVP
jgi:hypothetical protein